MPISEMRWYLKSTTALTTCLGHMIPPDTPVVLARKCTMCGAIGDTGTYEQVGHPWAAAPACGCEATTIIVNV